LENESFYDVTEAIAEYLQINEITTQIVEPLSYDSNPTNYGVFFFINGV